MCAMVSQLEPCRAFVWFAGHAFDDAPDEAGLTVCHANAHLAEVGQFVAKPVPKFMAAWVYRFSWAALLA